ncbi:hypothetical protein ACWCQL_04370 [Streptomyces sp. NPDC002073]|uniref:hypothetical protein n=1 Tax=Streptomyces sp. NBC_00239 TaxID=2903640 RepID=UPI002E2B4D59|nr:hypothetical protein [Streptomyces sp. NBC_00239]
MTYVVTGAVALPAGTPAGTAALVLVEVRDVSRADGGSTVVGAQVQTDVPIGPGGRIPFRVEVTVGPAPGALYSLRVHVDRTGSGVLEPGDLVTTESQPVSGARSTELTAPVTIV